MTRISLAALYLMFKQLGWGGGLYVAAAVFIILTFARGTATAVSNFLHLAVEVQGQNEPWTFISVLLMVMLAIVVALTVTVFGNILSQRQKEKRGQEERLERAISLQGKPDPAGPLTEQRFAEALEAMRAGRNKLDNVMNGVQLGLTSVASETSRTNTLLEKLIDGVSTLNGKLEGALGMAIRLEEQRQAWDRRRRAAKNQNPEEEGT